MKKNTHSANAHANQDNVSSFYVVVAVNRNKQEIKSLIGKLTSWWA